MCWYIKKGIFHGFVPHTICNIKWYNCDTGKIKTTNHIHFDKGVNDLPFDATPLNQRDLNLVKKSKSFPVEVDEVYTDTIFQFYIYPFAKMEERTLTVKTNCTSPTFGLKLARDPQYNQMFGKLILHLNEMKAIILCSHWQYHVKRYGQCRAQQ